MSVNEKIDAVTIIPVWKICKKRGSLLLKATCFGVAAALIAIFILPKTYSTTLNISEAKILPSNLNPLYLLDGVSPHRYDDKFKELNLTPAMALHNFLQFSKQQEIIAIETNKTGSNPDSYNVSLRSFAPSVEEFQHKVNVLLEETSNKFLDQRNQVIDVWITKENIERRYIFNSVALSSTKMLDKALELKSNQQASDSYPVIMNQCNAGDQECREVTLPLQIAEIFSTDAIKVRKDQLTKEIDGQYQMVELVDSINPDQLDLHDFIFVLDSAKPERQFAFHLIPLGLFLGLMIGLMVAVFMEYNQRLLEDSA